MDISIRTIDAGEVQAFHEAVMPVFFARPSAGYGAAQAPQWDLDRTWVAEDGGRIVATFRGFPTNVTVPGGSLAADAITHVAVQPSHRRRGILTEIMGRELDRAKERGEPVSVLIAAEYPIYSRYGYGPATFAISVSLDVEAARFTVPGSGRMRLASEEEVRSFGPGLYDRSRRAGSIDRNGFWWDVNTNRTTWEGRKPWEGWSVVHEGEDGTVDGYVAYRADEKWEDRRPLTVVTLDDFLAATPAASVAIWKYLGELDLAATVRDHERPLDDPLPWLLTDARAAVWGSRADVLWLRILDVAAALAGRRYRSEGHIVIEVLDGQGLAGGRFRLDAGHDAADCTSTTESADVTMPVSTLGAMYLGGVRARPLLAAGLLEEHRSGAADRLDLLMSAEQDPFCLTWF